MAVGSGVGASVGMVAETTYGTLVTPSRWLEFNSESLDFTRNFAQGMGLRAGGQLPRSSRRVTTSITGGGDIEIDAVAKQMGLPLSHALGTGVSTLISGSAYQQNFTLTDLAGKYLTIQKGVPQLDGTVKPYSFLGCKTTGLALSSSVDNILKLTFSYDARDLDYSTALTAPVYTTNANVFHFAQGAVMLGGTPTYATTTALATGGTTFANVRAIECKLDNNVAVDRFYYNNAGKKAEPIQGFRAISGKLTVDFVDSTFNVNYLTDTKLALIVTWGGSATSTLISGSSYEVFQLALPAIRLTNAVPQVGDDGIVTVDANFDVLDDGTNNPMQISIVTADTAL